MSDLVGEEFLLVEGVLEELVDFLVELLALREFVLSLEEVHVHLLDDLQVGSRVDADLRVQVQVVLDDRQDLLRDVLDVLAYFIESNPILHSPSLWPSPPAPCMPCSTR